MAYSSQSHTQSAAPIAAPASTIASTKTRAVFSAFAAIALGVLLVGGVGFAAPEAIHNAAHDSRHSLAFPCH